MIDICAVGEILIDLTQSGLTEQGIPRFDVDPGGAVPAMPTQEELLRFSEGEGTVGSC